MSWLKLTPIRTRQWVSDFWLSFFTIRNYIKISWKKASSSLLDNCRRFAATTPQPKHQPKTTKTGLAFLLRFFFKVSCHEIFNFVFSSINIIPPSGRLSTDLFIENFEITV